MRGLEAEVRERPPAPAPPAQRVQAGLVDKCCVSSVRRLRGLLLAPPLCRALRSTGAGEGRRDAFGDRALSGQVRKTLRGRDRRPLSHSRHARLHYSVIAPTPSELCLADGATGRSDARAVELPISVWAYFRPGIGVKFGIRAETILA